VGKATKPMLPLIAVPTTSGTGSECQSAALIADEVTHQKMACLDPKAAARVAILDPVLTLSQPARVTACTGVDALVHALESAVTKKRNAISAIYAREAFRLCFQSLPRVLERPDDLEARARMQLGAAFAGAAIENSMLGAAHSCANPLTARYNVVHGQAVGLMIRGVMRFNAELPEVEQVYRDLAGDVGLGSVKELISGFDAILEQSGLKAKLSNLGLAHDGVACLPRRQRGNGRRNSIHARLERRISRGYSRKCCERCPGDHSVGICAVASARVRRGLADASW
jgi:alcohol dehydrogenase